MNLAFCKRSASGSLVAMASRAPHVASARDGLQAWIVAVNLGIEYASADRRKKVVL
jgi:hypothetical protein